MGYAIALNGKQFTPEGSVSIPNIDEHNRIEEAREIEWLKTGPEKCVLYWRGNLLTPSSWDIVSGSDNRTGKAITTWMGTVVSTHLWVGPRRNVGFGFHTYRRAVSCRIFGVLYHGWYMESSGALVRLRKAKRQD